jgi:hypothetical protein
LKKKDLSNDAIASTKSERSLADIQAPLGRATTRSLERVAASIGLFNGAPIEFELVKDVPDGGVLLALPALLLLGLFSKSREMFSMPEGFYSLESIFLLLALIALARIPSDLLLAPTLGPAATPSGSARFEERQARLGLHEIDELAYAKVFLQFRLLIVTNVPSVIRIE